MKKHLLFIAFAVLIGLSGYATDRFYIEDFAIAPGETLTVSIMLDNETEYTAFQSDLYLPEGLSASNFALTDRKNSNHTFTATVLPDGGIRLLSYSLKLKTYSGNSGALVTFDVTASEEFAGDAIIVLQGTMFTTVAGVEIALDNEECLVSLPPAGLRGDVNGDNAVDITDATMLINYLLSGNPAGMNLTVADVNEDKLVDITDATMLINYLLSGTW